MFQKLKLSTKIALLVAASLLGLLFAVIYSATSMRNDMFEARRLQIRSVTEAVYNTLTDIDAQAKAGKLTNEQAKKAGIDALRTARYGGSDGKTEYFYAYTMKGVNTFHIRPEFMGQDLLEKIKDGQGRYVIKDLLAALQGKRSAFVDSSFPRPGSQVSVPKLQFIMHFEPWDWMIGTGVFTDDIDAAFRSRLWSELGVILFILIVEIALAIYITRNVLRQVGGEPEVANGIMARVATGDLSGEMPPAPSGSMLDSMGQMVAALRLMMRDINALSGQLARGAEQISTSSREVAQAAHKQSDATSSMAAAIEEMTVSINHISDNAKDTQQYSSSSLELSHSGVERIEGATREIRDIAVSVSAASDRIRKLEARARQISTIASVIKDIANQTNLLALNAAIEAARAGEQGRGFAVVADEVRKLAERTSTATVEIEQMISGIETDTVEVVQAMDATLPEVEEGISAAEEAATALRQIKDGATTTLEHIREVADSTREQSLASDNIAQKVEEIASMVEETSAAMQASAETAARLEQIASELNTLVGRFRC
mgnify:FL=1